MVRGGGIPLEEVEGVGVCCYTVRGRKCVGGGNSLKGSEGVGLCVWVGVLEGWGVCTARWCRYG